MSSEIAKKYVAELIGTFWLTLGGCGTAVIAASFPQTGVGLLGVAFAFGLTVECAPGAGQVEVSDLTG